MGKKSVREDKNIYQLAREEAGLTRAAAGELMDYVSESRIEKIESEKSAPHPEEILAMADAYKKPVLCNGFVYCFVSVLENNLFSLVSRYRQVRKEHFFYIT